MIIQDLARKCECDPATIRKWIKNNKIETYLTKSFNNKMVMSLSDENCEKFSSYWREITTLPDDLITIPDIAKQHRVDRKTVRLWAEKHCVQLKLLRSSSGPPTQAMSIEDHDRFVKEHNSAGSVAVLEILQQYNTDWRVIKRWVKKNDCNMIKIQSDLGGRAKFGLSKHNAEQLRKYLMQMKSEGFFYMIQPVPEFNLNRIKLGFSKKFSRRLKEHRNICPNAKLVKKWKCHKDDEQPTINKVTEGCKRLYTDRNRPGSGSCATEVFDCDDYKVVLARLEKLFEDKHVCK